MGAFINTVVVALQTFFKNDYIVTFFISMLPLIEVRGAIPIALQMGMHPLVAYFFSCISALVICPILILFLKPILNRLKKTKFFKNLANTVEETFKGKANKIESNAETKVEDMEKIGRMKTFYKMLGIYLFVAIPLPLTGLWTGTAIAVFMNMDAKKSMIPLVLGNFTAGAIITVTSLLLGEKSYLIILILFVFMIISLGSLVLSFVIKRKKQKQKEAKQIIYSDKDNE